MTDDIAIRVHNLSKRYRIGRADEVHDTMAGTLADFVKRPVHNLRRLRRLTRFSENGNEPDDVIWALKDVSFEVKRGEVVGIIGRNGAGKSTLLKILSRITHPTSGRIELNGQVSSLLEVGTGFHPELTGRENIYLNGTILGMRKSEIDRRFDEIIGFSGVEKYIDTPVKRYSSGMRVRLAFSVAAHLNPEILLIDEVLAVGDAEFQKKCLGKMESVSSAGRTVLFVSHNMFAIESLCQRAIWLEQGVVSSSGDTNAVIKSYLNRATSLASTQLSSRKDREGNGRLQFQQFLVRNSSGELITTVKSGQAVIFEMTLEMKEGAKFRDVAFQISFLDRMGKSIFVLLNRSSSRTFSEIESGDKVFCYIPSLPLLPGTYILHLHAKESHELLDGIREAIELEVTFSDFFGTGKLHPSTGGSVIVNHNWYKAEVSSRHEWVHPQLLTDG